jgi:DNA-binding transcriptional LysR family regulator
MAAARILKVSQPTVSTLVARVERQHGTELFFRCGRRLELTPLGTQLLDVTYRLFELEQEASDLLGAERGMTRGHLRVSAVGPFNVMPILASFIKRFPGMRVRMSVGDSRDVVQRILGYGADVGVLVHAEQDPRLYLPPLPKLRIIIMVPISHPLGRRRSVKLRDLEANHSSCANRAQQRGKSSSNTQCQRGACTGSRGDWQSRVDSRGGGGRHRAGRRFRRSPLSRIRASWRFRSRTRMYSPTPIVSLNERRSARVIAAFLAEAHAMAESWLSPQGAGRSTT